MVQLTTNLIIHKNNHLLLGYKKRGFGEGRWNGFGGKIKANEDIKSAAIREVQEEAGITPLGVRERGFIKFTFANDPLVIDMYIFSAHDYEGEPTETNEMLPRWYHVNNIPLEKMWADDEHWLPFFMAGKNVLGQVHFKDQQTILTHDIKVTNP